MIQIKDYKLFHKQYNRKMFMKNILKYIGVVVLIVVAINIYSITAHYILSLL